MLDKRAAIFVVLYCVALLSTLTAAQRSGYDTYAAPENGTCYKRVPYNEAVIANLSQGLIKTESTTPPPGIETWITIIDCCDGYQRDEYSGNCEFYCSEGCIGGNCTGPNECTCEDGWRAQRGECRPVCRQRCPQNSYCFEPDRCNCLFGYEEINDICRPICQHNCRNGDCVGPADCRCHRGYFLNETKHCEPICESGCQHGFCSAPGVCSCDQGYVNQLYDSESCVPECPPECGDGGECVTPNVCTCKPGYQQNDNGSCEARCDETCPRNGRCVAPNQCGCKAGYILDSQRKNCVELPRNFPSRNNQGQFNGVNNAYNPQQNRPYGTRRPNYDRTNNPNYQGGVYQTDNPYGYGQTEDPVGVIGLQDQVTTQNPQEGIYGNYGGNRTPRPQRPFTQQGTYATSTPYPTLGSRDGIGSTTYRPPTSDPRYTTPSPFSPLYPTQGSNGVWYPGQPQYGYVNRGNRPSNHSSQGPFTSRTPQTYHTTQSTFRPDEPRPTNGPYGPYDSHTPRPWRPTQSPFQPDEARPTEGPYGPYDPQTNRNPYDRRNPTGQQTPNNPYDQHRPSAPGIDRPYSPYFPNNPHDQGVKTGQRRPSYEPQLPYNPHRPYNPYAPTDPGVKTSYGGPPYNPRPTQEGSVYGPNNPHDTFGVKTAQRPSTDIYSRSSVLQSNPQSGIGFSYGIDHLNGRTFIGQPPSPVPGSFIVSDPYAQPGSSNVGGIIIVDSQQPPSISQLQAICDGPCINSHCIGLNLCMCEIGFIPDPRNPNGNACVPL